MSYKIVFFDLDGTLFNEEKQIPADAAEAVRTLKERGVEPVIATGRAPYFFLPVLESLGIDSYVSLNGAYVVYQGKPLLKRPIPRTNLEKLVALAGSNRHSLVFEGGEAYFTDTEAHPFVEEAISSLRVAMPGFDPVCWHNEDIYQVFLHCESHEEHLYEQLLTELKMVRWHAKAMDVLPADGSKALGIDMLLRHLNLRSDQAVAFGDGLNDKEMLKHVGLGIAMGNSHPELLPFADYVTAHVDEGGVVQGLRHAGLLP